MKKYKLITILLQDAVIKAVKNFGIEATEEKIKKVYSRHTKLKEAMLDAWRKLYLKKD